jgi:hypothetical protein
MFGHRSTIVAQAASMFSAFQHDRQIGGFMPECSNSANSPRAEHEVLTQLEGTGRQSVVPIGLIDSQRQHRPGVPRVDHYHRQFRDYARRHPPGPDNSASVLALIAFREAYGCRWVG